MKSLTEIRDELALARAISFYGYREKLHADEKILFDVVFDDFKKGFDACLKALSDRAEGRQFDIDSGSFNDGFYSASIHTPEDPYWNNIHVIEMSAHLASLAKCAELEAEISKLNNVIMRNNSTNSGQKIQTLNKCLHKAIEDLERLAIGKFIPLKEINGVKFRCVPQVMSHEQFKEIASQTLEQIKTMRGNV